MSAGRVEPGGLFADADFDFEAHIPLGAAAVGLGDVGLVLAVLDKIADGDRQSWFDAWSGMAAELAGQGRPPPAGSSAWTCPTRRPPCRVTCFVPIARVRPGRPSS